ncbi:MAG TPA: sugar nucleotide-binding protein, partial [Trueperaceae bacterium]|nr:sugar nucleotide-binding protein [Trueperaceae bacterium]
MKVLLTGASGRLGTELMALLPQQVATGDASVTVHGPSSSELDVGDGEAFGLTAREGGYDVIVHAAAFTDVGGAETRREQCWRTN